MTGKKITTRSMEQKSEDWFAEGMGIHRRGPQRTAEGRKERETCMPSQRAADVSLPRIRVQLLGVRYFENFGFGRAKLPLSHL